MGTLAHSRYRPTAPDRGFCPRSPGCATGHSCAPCCRATIQRHQEASLAARSSFLKQGRVLLPEDASWLAAFETELLVSQVLATTIRLTVSHNMQPGSWITWGVEYSRPIGDWITLEPPAAHYGPQTAYSPRVNTEGREKADTQRAEAEHAEWRMFPELISTGEK